MSGVEIEFSVEDGGNSERDDGVTEAEAEAGDPRTQANTAAGGRSRSQGQ